MSGWKGCDFSNRLRNERTLSISALVIKSRLRSGFVPLVSVTSPQRQSTFVCEQIIKPEVEWHEQLEKLSKLTHACSSRWIGVACLPAVIVLEFGRVPVPVWVQVQFQSGRSSQHIDALVSFFIYFIFFSNFSKKKLKCFTGRIVHFNFKIYCFGDFFFAFFHASPSLPIKLCSDFINIVFFYSTIICVFFQRTLKKLFCSK